VTKKWDLRSLFSQKIVQNPTKESLNYAQLHSSIRS